MGKSIGGAMKDFIGTNDDMCVFVYDYTDGSFEISPIGKIGILFESADNPLVQLCNNKNIHPADSRVVTAFCRDLLELRGNKVPDDRFTVNFRINFSDGEPDYKWAAFTVIIKTEGETQTPVYTVGHIRLMNSAELQKKIAIDSFTNDKHPNVFNACAVSTLQNSGDKKAAVIQFDIKQFKLINAKYGEKIGTEILTYISEGLDSICGGDKPHIRLSADVFALITAYEDKDELERLIENIKSRLSQYGDIKYKLVFGVFEVTDKTIPVRHMGDRAAIARQGIKNNALCDVGYYTENQKDTLLNRKFIEDRMYYALEHHEFVMYLQPKYSIDSPHIVGAEALVRWIHPEKGIISPADFIPIFEKDGFIVKVDEYMWEQACSTIRSWIDAGLTPLPISVNISRVHLSDDRFVKILDGLAAKYEIPKKYLEAEITESVENDNSGEMIKLLKDSGYTLLMDDFGSGYSSLNMLKSTPFDVIKIDKDFFSEFMLSDRGKKIISHTISMSKDIGLDLVAEGVETKEQAQFLYDSGCRVAQGFYYSKPVTVDEFNKIAFGDAVIKK
ncbi:MAG: GGDEF domain-containing phosphodiesterase [Ruminococcus sp.]|nr:GGDEF domain-containing phosphodiesterase [Ruminococcus sp.]MCM1381396.1 GGDEF domain-containing phosphodiesterase [Muribaculaceae bacterium]MCM1480515.1 GGDEF domain-containing phosphodiesterase [Muribaculaceae bacterium]